jgi:hypothetical protein
MIYVQYSEICIMYTHLSHIVYIDYTNKLNVILLITRICLPWSHKNNVML